jgi:AcrR family transcriptional regulator
MATTATMVAKARDADRTRAAILLAAQQAFSRRGFGATGVRDIAAEAGVNPALVNRYFGSKLGLFEAALSAALDVTRITNVPREGFGRSLARLFGGGEDGAVNPLPMLAFAAADRQAQAIALESVRERIAVPLAEWLGPPDAEARAAAMMAVASGFFTYRLLYPLPAFEGGMDPAARRWLEDNLQRLVDGKV